MFAQRAGDCHRRATRIGRSRAAGAYVPTASPRAYRSGRQRTPWLMAGRGAVPRRAAAGADAARTGRATTTRSRTSAAAARQAQRRADRDRALLGVPRCPPIYYGVRALGGRAARPRRRAQRAAARRGGAGDGRRADRRLRRQVPLRLLASGDRDPQRRHRRQRRHRARRRAGHSLIDAPMHPEYPSGARHPGRRRRPRCCKAEIGSGPMPVLATSSPTAKGATRRWTRSGRLRARSGQRAHLRRHPLPLLGRRRPRARPQSVGDLTVTRFANGD
ncbi:MAG: hypothetical protein MZW92_75965 [Comamonadaceae bacterium]|nr:hypothetical protein [Comamonadaceae bacterium]